MTITTNDDWTWSRNYEVAFATTSDPRVVAVIEQDHDFSLERCLDGDAIPGVYSIEYLGDYRSFHVGGYDGDRELAARILRARSDFRYVAGYRYDGLSIGMIIQSEETLKRWAWIFYGAAIEFFGDGSSSYMAINSQRFRDNIDWTDCAQGDAEKSVQAVRSETMKIIEGQVYGVGFATNVGRVLDDGESIDILDPLWQIEIECFGLVGEEYAKESAAGFEYGDPILDDLLDLSELDEPGFIEHTDWMAEVSIREAELNDRGL